MFAPKLGFETVDREAVDYLIKHHYERVETAISLLPPTRPVEPGPQLLCLQ